MSKRNLWVPQAYSAPHSLQADPPSSALEAWAKFPAFAKSDSNIIEIFGEIGNDPFGDGFSPKDMAAALRDAGDSDVTVAINSPGGSFFDGVTIYNQLREHKGAVTVNIMGLAASAASIIAMAGDEINMGVGTELMIHNSWGLVIGNYADLREASELFARFDKDMAAIYATRSGMSEKDVLALMEKDTFFSANEAVVSGFADAISGEKQPDNGPKTTKNASAKRQIEAILARQGVPRSERRRMFRELTGTHDAADDTTHDAGDWPMAALNELLNTLTT